MDQVIAGGCVPPRLQLWPRESFRWDIFYDSELPGVYLETFRVDSWGEHERQHDRFTVADRECEERVLRFTLAPVKTRHFLYADRIEPQGGEP